MRIIAKRTLRRYWESTPKFEDSKEGDELDVLSVLVERYEAVFHSINTPDPIQAIHFQMEQFGLKNQDLIPFIGQSLDESLKYCLIKENLL
jgi:HTH-type transcriptional regulator/antitoxin HigA